MPDLTIKDVSGENNLFLLTIPTYDKSGFSAFISFRELENLGKMINNIIVEKYANENRIKLPNAKNLFFRNEFRRRGIL